MGMVGLIRAISEEQAGQVKRGEADSWELLDADESEYLDKAWHGLHFLLCGDAWGAVGVLGEALMGGASIGEDGGYGPARYLDPQRAAAVHAALSAVDVDELREGFDPEAFQAAEVYPQIWDEEDAVDYPLGYLEAVRGVYAAAAAAGHGVLIGIT